MTPHLLVVEDDPAFCRLYEEYLQSVGYRVSLAKDAASARSKLTSETYDLVILDLGLPEGDGLDLLRELRSRSSVPVIIVSGKSEPVDRVIGIEVGADDYLGKPFLARELLARVKSVLRRMQGGEKSKGSETAEPKRMHFANHTLDLLARTLTLPSGELAKITTAEFDLLHAFARSAGRALSREALLDLVHGRDWSPADRSIDVHIVNLRRKIEPDPKNPIIIRTVRGIGYLFVPEVTKE